MIKEDVKYECGFRGADNELYANSKDALLSIKIKNLEEIVRNLEHSVEQIVYGREYRDRYHGDYTYHPDRRAIVEDFIRKGPQFINKLEVYLNLEEEIRILKAETTIKTIKTISLVKPPSKFIRLIRKILGYDRS